MDEFREQRALNADYWSRIRDKHLADWYDLDSFRAGSCTLRSVEVEALGDVTGKRLLHLQCNCGLDTLSWARRGAIVTGVDLSDRSVELARRLASEEGIEARFVHSDVMDLNEALPETFDIVFTSYGVLAWLPDLEAWGRTIARHLRPGGTFLIVDMHPFSHIFDDEHSFALNCSRIIHK